MRSAGKMGSSEMKNRTDVNVTKQTPELVEKSENIDSKRRLLSAAAPAVLTLLSIPAFGARGAVCSISGMQSVNPSGVTRHTTTGCGGYSPGAWKTPYGGNGDGSLADWHQAGLNYYNQEFYPNPGSGNGANPTSSSEPATLFSSIFTSPGDPDSLHDKLEQTGDTFERSTVEAFINACFFQWGVGANTSIHAIDVVGLYNATPGSQYQTVKGNTVTVPSDGDLHIFFYNLMH